jgi:integrase/recombinase XerD
MANNLYRRGSIWWGRIQVSGREIRSSMGTSNKTDAQRRLGEWLRQINGSAYDGRERVLWQDAAIHYIKSVMPDNVKPRTAERYLVSLRQVAPHLHDVYVDEIDEGTITSLIKARKLDEITNATIRRDLSAISNVLRAAKLEKWCAHNAAATYDRGVIKEIRDPIDLPTDADVDAAIAAVPPMMGRMMRLAEKTGMRENEIVTLEHSQLRKANDGTPQIRLTKTKTNRPRVIRLDGPILGEAVPLLGAVPRYLNCRLFFWHGEGEGFQNFASNYAAQKKSHKFRFRFHDLRHKFAVDYLRRGGNIYDLQKILGHSSIKTTELYLNYLDPEEQKIAQFGHGFQPIAARSA